MYATHLIQGVTARDRRLIIQETISVVVLHKLTSLTIVLMDDTLKQCRRDMCRLRQTLHAPTLQMLGVCLKASNRELLYCCQKHGVFHLCKTNTCNMMPGTGTCMYTGLETVNVLVNDDHEMNTTLSNERHEGRTNPRKRTFPTEYSLQDDCRRGEKLIRRGEMGVMTHNFTNSFTTTKQEWTEVVHEQAGKLMNDVFITRTDIDVCKQNDIRRLIVQVISEAMKKLQPNASQERIWDTIVQSVNTVKNSFDIMLKKDISRVPPRNKVQTTVQDTFITGMQSIFRM